MRPTMSTEIVPMMFISRLRSAKAMARRSGGTTRAIKPCHATLEIAPGKLIAARVTIKSKARRSAVKNGIKARIR